MWAALAATTTVRTRCQIHGAVNEMDVLKTTCLVLVFIMSARANGQPHGTRPITESDGVIAIYRSRVTPATPPIIFAAWSDGFAIWSDDHLEGGPPYSSGWCSKDAISNLLRRLESEGLFKIRELNRGHYGPNSSYTTILVRSGKDEVKMSSWHDMAEAGGKLVATAEGIRPLEERTLLEVLSTDSKDYLYFRMVWSDLRRRFESVLPLEGDKTEGRAIQKAGIITWEEY